jgi:hypothetical protein
MDYPFVKQLLDLLLQPSKPAKAPYPSGVLRFLLEKDLVSASMAENGLLEALRLRNDWVDYLFLPSHVT